MTLFGEWQEGGVRLVYPSWQGLHPVKLTWHWKITIFIAIYGVLTSNKTSAWCHLCSVSCKFTGNPSMPTHPLGNKGPYIRGWWCVSQSLTKTRYFLGEGGLVGCFFLLDFQVPIYLDLPTWVPNGWVLRKCHSWSKPQKGSNIILLEGAVFLNINIAFVLSTLLLHSAHLN